MRDSRAVRVPAWMTRDISLRDVILFVIAALAALGLSNPIKRIGALEQRVDGIEEQQRFTNYLLCVQIRRTDPSLAPKDCTPIIDERRAR